MIVPGHGPVGGEPRGPRPAGLPARLRRRGRRPRGDPARSVGHVARPRPRRDQRRARRAPRRRPRRDPAVDAEGHRLRVRVRAERFGPRPPSWDRSLRRATCATVLAAMAKNPDPTLKLTSSKGVTRTLDDWSTMFHLCLVILPDRPEASVFVPIAQRIFATFGDADCRDRLRRDRQRVRGRPDPRAGPSRGAHVLRPRQGVRARASGSSGSPRSSTSARTRPSWPPPRAGTPTSGSGWPGRSARRWPGPSPRSRPAIPGVRGWPIST